MLFYLGLGAWVNGGTNTSGRGFTQIGAHRLQGI